MSPADLHKQTADEHRRLHFGWIRDVIKLAASGLALTVSLQSFFVKSHPSAIWLLAFSWASLVFAILFGLWALRGEVDLIYTATDSLGFLRRETGDNAQAISEITKTEPLAELRPEYKRACSAMIAFFVAGLLGFVVFGILNLPYF